MESSVAKLLRKQLEGKWKSSEEINNILRATIIVKNPEEGREIVRKLGDSVAKFDDYFLNPKGKYKGINVDLMLPDGSLAELQIHTKSSNGFAEKIHQEYRKAQVAALKRAKPAPTTIGAEAKAVSTGTEIPISSQISKPSPRLLRKQEPQIPPPATGRGFLAGETQSSQMFLQSLKEKSRRLRGEGAAQPPAPETPEKALLQTGMGGVPPKSPGGLPLGSLYPKGEPLAKSIEANRISALKTGLVVL